MDSFSSRIGCFFLFIGAILLIIFLSSDLAKRPEFGYLFWSLLLLLSGFIFWKRGYSAPPPSGRFRLLKRPKNNEPKK